MFSMDAGVEIGREQALHLAAAMREVALADGVNPAEQALLDSFTAELDGELPETADPSLFDTPALKDLFMRSLALVALADTEVSDAELAVIDRYADALGLDREARRGLLKGVARELLSHFQGVRHFREQVFSIGRSLGLEDPEIEEILAS